MKITYRELKNAGACADQLAEFKRRYGKSIEVTEEACAEVAQVFDWDWAAYHLLTEPARKAYRDAIAPARKAYDDAIAPARKAYDDAIAPAQKAYNDAIAPAQKAYNDAIAPARKAYDDAIARAFARAYIG